ncbi:MAG TPA: putative LPS assembly protein LptD, partial [Candidatus Cloacimonadota bacterium]|nr:putative LPS assembly protein LptD [Candidatus Cloacimonadota bacterium]
MNQNHNKNLYIFIIILISMNLAGFVFQRVYAQNNEIIVSDSLKTEKIIDDSLFYESDSLEYYVNLEKIKLRYNSMIRYGNATIKSDSMLIDFDKEQAHAEGRILMQDGDQVILGDQVYYDIDTETGFILGGASKFELGFYYGQKMRKIDNEVFDVDKGRFTTCDAKEPHFDIRGNQMRIYRNHMVVARPIYFYVNEFPVMAFPFAAFSIKKGRESGLLVPEPGYNPSDGKYLKNIAYYLPINDYTDMTLSADFTEKSGWGTEFDMPYRKRYDYNGNLHALYRKHISDITNYSDEWSVRAYHQQKFYNKSEFSLNLDFASSRQVWDNQSDVDKRLQESITSNISYRKPFKSSTLYMSGAYTEDLI